MQCNIFSFHLFWKDEKVNAISGLCEIDEDDILMLNMKLEVVVIMKLEAVLSNFVRTTPNLKK